MSSSSNTLSNALEGIRVLDLSRLFPGPYLAMILADMGADVIKIEEPRVGDYLRTLPPIHPVGMSGRFLALNRNKRSLCLDLKQQSGRNAFLRMVEQQADVVVESFRPRVMDRLGVGYSTLLTRNPNIILCSVSGYGQSGSYATRSGHDLNYMALCGALRRTANEEPPSSTPKIQVADFAGGGLWGATAVMGALFRRERQHGGGAHLDISMTEGVMSSMLSTDIGKLNCCGENNFNNIQEDLGGDLACYRLYKTRDEKLMSVAALEPKFWIEFNQAIGRLGSVKEIMAPADKQQEIAQQIQKIMQTKTRKEWTQHFEEFDCCVEPVLDLDEVKNHPAHTERNTFFTMDGGKGEGAEITQVKTPVGETKAHLMAPMLGEHSREILAEYGFESTEIDELLTDDLHS